MEAVDAVASQSCGKLVTTHDTPAPPIKLVGKLAVSCVSIDQETVSGRLLAAPVECCDLADIA